MCRSHQTHCRKSESSSAYRASSATRISAKSKVVPVPETNSKKSSTCGLIKRFAMVAAAVVNKLTTRFAPAFSIFCALFSSVARAMICSLGAIRRADSTTYKLSASLSKTNAKPRERAMPAATSVRSLVAYAWPSLLLAFHEGVFVLVDHDKRQPAVSQMAADCTARAAEATHNEMIFH